MSVPACLTSGPFSLTAPPQKQIKGYIGDDAIGLNPLKLIFQTENEFVLTFLKDLSFVSH